MPAAPAKNAIYVTWPGSAHLTSRYHFDADDAAESDSAFFRLCRHTKGEWAGQPVTLEPWQQFCVGSVFGWKRVSDVRLLAVPQRYSRQVLDQTFNDETWFAFIAWR